MRTLVLLGAASLSACGGGLPPAYGTMPGTLPESTLADSEEGDDDDGDGDRCPGIQRWDTKTGSDANASDVEMGPAISSIGELWKLQPPSGYRIGALLDDHRFAPAETQVYELQDVTLVKYNLQDDQDYHLVLRDGRKTMVAEIPDPACVGSGSPFRSGVRSARNAFDAHFRSAKKFKDSGESVRLRGPAFFDKKHNAKGTAPNCIEIHPVIAFCVEPCDLPR